MDNDSSQGSRGLVNEAGEVNFAKVWSILSCNYRSILSFAVLVALVVGVVNKFFIPSYYISSAMIIPRSDRASDSKGLFQNAMGGAGGATLGQILSGTASNVEIAQFEKLLQSRRIALQVAKDAELNKIVTIDPSLPPEAFEDAAYNWLSKRLKIKSDKNSLSMLFEHTDPKLAALILREYVSSLQEFLQSTSNTRAKAAESFIKGRLEDALGDLKTLEARYVELQKSSGVIEINSQSSLVVSTAAQLRTQLIEKEMEIDLYEKIFKDQSQLRKLYAERDQLKAQIDRLYVGKGQRGDVLKPLKNLPDLAADFASVQNEFLTQKAIVEFLRQQYEVAQIESKRTESMFQIVDEPNVPYFRAGPKTRQNTMVAFLAALIFSCLVILIVHRYRDSQSMPRPLLRIIKTDLTPKVAGSRRY